ncbi:sensor histidine kinase [Tunturiibacter gelidoferens]|jgi:signal transduction histidine kinase|uniref:histidine kinase n=1 Tax=Tunturiibacter gelidiferens TaxID=3069689 RepID=A0A9X0QD75_9BACT|nr:ATP-binding protein [Edaphobacter lichenicola]MBB5328138.1 signal transduction histidine kinase [Edaphobacter lichenicola]
MRLKTKLVLAATALTFAIVLVLSALFLSELLRQRIEQTASANDTLSREVLLVTRLVVEAGLKANPPVDRSDEALHAAVVNALRTRPALADVMNAIVRYSPTVQDVSVTDAHGMTLLSTDPDAVDQPAVFRFSLESVQNGPLQRQMRVLFGKPRVLDVSQSLERNGFPFLVVHMGVRSTFLRNSYEPWLLDALIFAALAALAAMLSAGLLANVALRPLEAISARLEMLSRAAGAIPERLAESRGTRTDEVVRVTRTLDRLGEQMRTQEAGYTALQANLNQMLDTLRDGVLLFTADRRAVMVSDAVAYFLGAPLNEDHEKLVGMRLEEIFAPDSVLGEAVLEAFEGGQVSAQVITLEDGRQVQFSLDRIDDGLSGAGNVTTLLTLRDMESVAQLGQEIEVARRLAAIGRLTAGVGHEVKNPINAMVLHLELLRGKLAPGGVEALGGAQRHVEILAGEMQRLDRVVQTLADFSRPMELHLREHDLRQVVGIVMELTAAEMQENQVVVVVNAPKEPLMVRVDAQLMQQALLNLLLNGMQAMPDGGAMVVRLRRDHQFAVVEVIDEGVGIPPELLPRIFELYFTTKPKGSGIGLAMTYRILQLHGGAMEVRSNADPNSVERGTTFTFRLPIAAGTATESRKAAAAGAVHKELEERV